MQLVHERFPDVLDRAGQQGDGRRQQRRDAACPWPLLLPAQLRCLGGRRLARAARSLRRRAPGRRRDRAEAPQHRRDAAALGAGRADAVAARDGVPLHPQARAALAAAEPALRRRLRPRRGARGGVALRACAARAARGGRCRGALRRGVLHVQRGGRLADALPPRRLEGAVLPGGRGRPRRGGASHGGGLYVENLRGHLRWFDKHKSPRQAEWARRLLLVSLRLRALIWRHGARGREVREGIRFLSSGAARTLLQ